MRQSARGGLRRALGSSDWVLYSDRRYSLNTARGYDCDVAAFELALTEARKARGGDALPALQRALAAYGGDFLAGLATGEWAAARRDELRRSFESALLATGRLHAAADRHQAAATAFRRAVAHEPLNETAHRELMQSWAHLGETARAVRHYEQLTHQLAGQPLSATVHAVLAAGDLALVLGEREIAGTGPGSEPVRLSGLGSSVVRRQPDGTWCIVAEAWCLHEPGPPGPLRTLPSRPSH